MVACWQEKLGKGWKEGGRRQDGTGRRSRCWEGMGTESKSRVASRKPKEEDRREKIR